VFFGLEPFEQGHLLLAVCILVSLAGLRVCADEELLALGCRVDLIAGVSQVHAQAFFLAVALLGRIASTIKSIWVDETTLIICRCMGPDWRCWCEGPASAVPPASTPSAFPIWCRIGELQVHFSNMLVLVRIQVAHAAALWALQAHNSSNFLMPAISCHTRAGQAFLVQNLLEFLVIVHTCNLLCADLLLPSGAHLWVVAKLSPVAGFKVVFSDCELAFLLHDIVACGEFEEEGTAAAPECN